MGGDEEREEIQDEEQGEGLPINWSHGFPVCIRVSLLLC